MTGESTLREVLTRLGRAIEALEQAGTALARLTDFAARVAALEPGSATEPASEPGPGPSPEVAERTRAAREAFDQALDDDLNTSRALGVLFDWVRDVNRALDVGTAGPGDRPALAGFLQAFDEVYDVLRPDPDETALSREVEDLISQREAARKARDWARADAIRDDDMSRYIL